MNKIAKKQYPFIETVIIGDFFMLEIIIFGK